MNAKRTLLLATLQMTPRYLMQFFPVFLSDIRSNECQLSRGPDEQLRRPAFPMQKLIKSFNTSVSFLDGNKCFKLKILYCQV